MVCNNCKKKNPDDFQYCRYCGNHLVLQQVQKRKKIWQRLPSWALIILAVAGIVLFIIGIQVFFIGVTSVSGFASILFLIGGIFLFGLFRKSKPEISTGVKAIMIGFFAFMGATIDQTGNYLYNKPVELICCPDNTSLYTRSETSNPLPGTTYVQQDFTCYDAQNSPVKKINMFAVLGIRFIEYMLLGYLLFALRILFWKLRYN